MKSLLRRVSHHSALENKILAIPFFPVTTLAIWREKGLEQGGTGFLALIQAAFPLHFVPKPQETTWCPWSLRVPFANPDCATWVSYHLSSLQPSNLSDELLCFCHSQPEAHFSYLGALVKIVLLPLNFLEDSCQVQLLSSEAALWWGAFSSWHCYLLVV